MCKKSQRRERNTSSNTDDWRAAHCAAVPRSSSLQHPPKAKRVPATECLRRPSWNVQADLALNRVAREEEDVLASHIRLRPSLAGGRGLGLLSWLISCCIGVHWGIEERIDFTPFRLDPIRLRLPLHVHCFPLVGAVAWGYQKPAGWPPGARVPHSSPSMGRALPGQADCPPLPNCPCPAPTSSWIALPVVRASERLLCRFTFAS